MNTPVNRTVLYALVLTLIAVLAVGVNSIVYANHVSEQARKQSEDAIRKSEQQLCSIINLFDSTYNTNPPTTNAGRQLQQYFKDLKKGYGC